MQFLQQNSNLFQALYSSLLLLLHVVLALSKILSSLKLIAFILFQGWANLVSSFLTLHLLLISLDVVSGQLWGTEPWEPERRAKSLGFLGRDEVAASIDNNSLTASRDDDGKHDKDDGKEDDKKAILNVSDKDSPYALIDKYFPERESYFYQNHNKFQTEYRQLPADKREDIGALDPSEVRILKNRRQKALN